MARKFKFWAWYHGMSPLYRAVATVSEASKHAGCYR